METVAKILDSLDRFERAYDDEVVAELFDKPENYEEILKYLEAKLEYDQELIKLYKLYRLYDLAKIGRRHLSVRDRS